MLLMCKHVGKMKKATGFIAVYSGNEFASVDSLPRC